MRFLIKILITGLAVLVSSYLLPGVTVPNMITAIYVAAVLAVLNAFV